MLAMAQVMDRAKGGIGKRAGTQTWLERDKPAMAVSALCGCGRLQYF